MISALIILTCDDFEYGNPDNFASLIILQSIVMYYFISHEFDYSKLAHHWAVKSPLIRPTLYHSITLALKSCRPKICEIRTFIRIIMILSFDRFLQHLNVRFCPFHRKLISKVLSGYQSLAA